MFRWLLGAPINLLGVYAALALQTFALGVFYQAYTYLTRPGDLFRGAPSDVLYFLPAWAAYPLIAVMLVIAAVTGWPLGDGLKVWLARGTKRLRRMLDAMQFGKGGSSAFAGILEDWGNRYEPGGLFLGRSLHEPWWRVGWKDDRGFLTIAGSRAGKGRGAIIPNLLLWPGSALVIDPKGTNAAVTAARRGKGGGRVTEFLGQDVYVVDPFGIVPGVASARFNPLAAIDPAGPEFAEEVALLADALVVAERESEASHWDEGVKILIGGIIAFLVMSGREATLLDLRRALTAKDTDLDRLFQAMLAAGGLAATAASLMRNAGPNERGSFLTTALRNTQWLESAAMQPVITASDFDVRDLKRKAMTVYVVLPPEYLEEHKRFMRLFVNLAIRGVSKGKRPKHPILFVLDEFYSLGRLTVMEKASGLLASYGLKLWPVIQNIGQLQHLYPHNWETFFANAGAVQYFGVNDKATGEYLIARLGKAAREESIGQREMRIVEELREVQEIEREVSREAGKQIIFRSGDLPMRLRRISYDSFFPKTWFNIDPDFGGNSPESPETIAEVISPDARRALGGTPPAVAKPFALPLAPKLPLSFSNENNDPFARLDALIGLELVKRKVKSLISQYQIRNARIKEGLPVPALSHHLVFTGNPGTGKTTVARLIGDIYRELGILSKGHLVEVDRLQLIGEHVGETAPKVLAKVKEAMGGVLFIDEAYTLKVKDSPRDFGTEAIATLLKLMEDNRDRFAVIVAGYTKEMKEFIASNPGLSSRFKTVLEFSDLNPEELTEVVMQLLEEHHFTVPEETRAKLFRVMSRMYEERDAHFGNARAARNLFEAIDERMSLRLSEADLTREELTTVLPIDIPDTVQTTPDKQDWTPPPPPVANNGDGREVVRKRPRKPKEKLKGVHTSVGKDDRG